MAAPQSATIYLPGGKTQNVAGDPSTFASMAASLGGSLTPPDAPASGAVLGTGLSTAPVPGEPAVLSSRAGAAAFQTKVQPAIDAANQTVVAAKKASDARAAAAAAVAASDPIPQDVLDEINSSQSPEDQAYAAQLTAWNNQEQQAKDASSNLTLANNAQAAAQISSLQGEWAQRKQLLEQANSADVANWNQQFIRTGQAEYSPGMTGTFISGKEQEGIAKVKALDDEYNAKIAAVNTALASNNYAQAAKLTADLTAIEDKAIAAMADNAKTAAAANQKIKDANNQAKLEMTISGAVKQGLTTAADIQDYLNTTGTASGTTPSLDDIDKVLKIVNPSADLTGLSADYKTFKYLQDNKDPAVSGMNYYDYLKAVHIASTNPTDAPGTFKFSQTQQSQLLAGGFNSQDIANMQADIASYGIDQVTSGMSATQQALVKRVLASNAGVADVVSPDEQTYTREKIAQLYGIKDDGSRPPGVYGGETSSQKLDEIMSRIQQWYDAGYTDKDISKALGLAPS